MTFSEAELKSLKKDILRFKDKITLDNERVGFIAAPSTADGDEGSREKVYRMKLNPPGDNFKLTSVKVFDDVTKEDDTKLVYVSNGMSADLENRIKRQVEEEFGSDDESVADPDVLLSQVQEEDEESFREFLSTLKIDQLLRPITKPSDVVNIKPVSQIYRARFLEKLSNDTVELVEREQEMVNLLNKTMDIFLSANPEHIAADNLGLPEYEHNLDLDKFQQNQLQGTPQIHDEYDPFFRPPKYESDPGFENIKPEEIDETRHLLQIALQRNEEYIRSLMQIRLGFLHADNYREQIYKWCKEMNENDLNQK